MGSEMCIRDRWNKQKKLNEQTKKQILEPNDPPNDPPLKTTDSKSSSLSSYMILSVSAAAGVLGYLLYNQYIKQQKPTKPEVSNKPFLDKEIPESKQPPIKPDPFLMH